jgi:microcystin-dependent protein
VSDFFLGEIRMFPFSFAPKGWALANGAMLQVGQNQALFSLLGNRYGGDGRMTFALPDLRGRTPLNFGAPQGGSVYQVGSAGGVESVQLSAGQVPAHRHSLTAQTAVGTRGNATGCLVAAVALDDLSPPNQRLLYAADTSPLIAIAPGSIGSAGGGGAHSNMQPFTVVNFCISMTGYYPPHQ